MTTIANNLQQGYGQDRPGVPGRRARPGPKWACWLFPNLWRRCGAGGSAAGQRAFGENHIQEGVDKIAAAGAWACPALQWHRIGPIQSNKTRPGGRALRLELHTVDWLQDRRALVGPAARSPAAAAKQICIQVNA